MLDQHWTERSPGRRRIHRPSDDEIRAIGYGARMALAPPSSGAPAAPTTVQALSALGTLVCMYEADSGVTLNAGAASGWADQGPQGIHLTQATGSKQPAYNATGLNSKPALVFTRANSQSLRSTTSLFLGDPGCTTFTVTQCTDTSFSTAISWGTSAAAAAMGVIINYNAAHRFALSGSGASAIFTAPLNTFSSATLTTLSKTPGIYSGANSYGYTAGVSRAMFSVQAVAPNVAAGNTWVGEFIVAAGTTYAFAGAISSIVVFSPALGLVAQAAAEAILTAKWL